MSEAEERAAVVAAALSWIGTPYRHRAAVKGVGVDCAMLLRASFEEAGLIEPGPIPRYSPQFHLNRDVQAFITALGVHATEFEPDWQAEPPVQPADVVIWQFGRVFSHVGVVIEWPRVVHAVLSVGCYVEDLTNAVWLSKRGANDRPARFFSYWGAA